MAPTDIPRCPLGKDGPLVPRLGFGLMGMSYQVYGAISSDEERFKLLDRALEQGNTFWDSSDLYGDSEELVGKWFKRTGKRDQIFLATKFGYIKGSTTLGFDSSAAYAKKACNESLKALGIDTIDLYYLHMADDKTPIEATMRAMLELKAEGKIKHIGLSMISSNTLRRACKVGRVDAIQTEYSVFSRDIEGPEGTNLLATARELGIAVVLSSPLGRGMMTSNFGSGTALQSSGDARGARMPRFHEDNRSHNEDIVRRFAEIAAKKGCSVPQLTLAWLLKQGDDIFPIPGTKKMQYLEQNWDALDVSLTDAEADEIDKFSKSVEVAGGILPEQYAGMHFRDTPEE